MERGYELKDQNIIYYRWPKFFEYFLIFSPNFWNFKWLWSMV